MSWSGCVWRPCLTNLLVDRVRVLPGACLVQWTRLCETQTSTVATTSRALTDWRALRAPQTSVPPVRYSIWAHTPPTTHSSA